MNSKQFSSVMTTVITVQDILTHEAEDLLSYFLQGLCIPVNCLQTTVEPSTFQPGSQTGTQELLRQISTLPS